MKEPTEIEYEGSRFPIDEELTKKQAEKLMELLGPGGRSWLDQFGYFRLIRGKDEERGSDDYYLYHEEGRYIISHPSHSIVGPSVEARKMS